MKSNILNICITDSDTGSALPKGFGLLVQGGNVTDVNLGNELPSLNYYSTGVPNVSRPGNRYIVALPLRWRNSGPLSCGKAQTRVPRALLCLAGARAAAGAFPSGRHLGERCFAQL